MAKAFATFCLILVLFIASFDKYGVDGVVPLIQQNYNINDAQTAIIRTSSSVAHTTTLLLVWIFGDVFDRRKLMLSSIALWSGFSILSIILGSKSFMVFVAFRTLAAIPFAVLGVLSPVVLADLYQDRALGVALMCVTASDVISGIMMGIINSAIISNGLPWQSGLLAYPVLVILPLLALFCMKSFRCAERSDKSPTLKRIFTNAFGFLSIKSYLLLTASLALGTFHMQAYTFWFPSMTLNAWNSYPEIFLGLSYTGITSLDSTVVLAGTVCGLPAILWFAQSWNHGAGPFSGRKGYARAYPIVVSTGAALHATMVISTNLLFASSYVAIVGMMLFMGIGSAADTSLSQQMMLMVIPTSSRSGAVALSRLIGGVFSTPAAQLVGMISDAIRGDSSLPFDSFHAYQVGLLCASVFLIGSVLCDIVLIFFFPEDCEMAKTVEKEEEVDENTALVGSKERSDSLRSYL